MQFENTTELKIISDDQIKKIELEILQNIADFCEQNKLNYFLAYGTLIGAIRHEGFIPWDDDVDIWMPREDYNRLLRIYSSRNNHYKVISPYDKESRHSYIKIVDMRTIKIENNVDYTNGNLGIDIDIFPLDGQPDDYAVFKKWYKKLQGYYRYYPFLITKKWRHWRGRVVQRLIKICFDRTKILDKTAILHKKYPYAHCEYVGATESCYNSPNNRYKKVWFSKSVEVSFEGKKFKAPIGYDEILTQMYGDYMKLPPKEQQVTHHSYKAYWRNENEKI